MSLGSVRVTSAELVARSCGLRNRTRSPALERAERAQTRGRTLAASIEADKPHRGRYAPRHGYPRARPALQSLPDLFARAVGGVARRRADDPGARRGRAAALV